MSAGNCTVIVAEVVHSLQNAVTSELAGKASWRYLQKYVYDINESLGTTRHLELHRKGRDYAVSSETYRWSTYIYNFK